MTEKKNLNKLIKVNSNGYLSLKIAVPTHIIVNYLNPKSQKLFPKPQKETQAHDSSH
jgi:hypothetical protein